MKRKLQQSEVIKEIRVDSKMDTGCTQYVLLSLEN